MSGGESAAVQVLWARTDGDPVAAAWALAGVVLAQHLGVDAAQLRFTRTCRACGRTDHGKPTLVGLPGRPAVQFSLSHSGDRVAVGVTEAGSVGVDVEAESATRFSGFGDVALSPAEAAVVRSLPAPRRPAAQARYWTRKEAVLKATGHGLTIDPASIEVSAPDGYPRLLRWSGAGTIPAVTLFDVEVGPGYAACVAVASPSPLSVSVSDVTDRLATLATTARTARP